MQEGDRPAADASSEPGIQVGLTSEFTLFSEPYDADTRPPTSPARTTPTPTARYPRCAQLGRVDVLERQLHAEVHREAALRLTDQPR